jgi:hypothetical protein
MKNDLEHSPQNDLNAEKEVEFYAAGVNAWLNTRLELDKGLLSLSAAGIGLLVTLLPTGAGRSVELFVLYILALLAFLTCIGSILLVLKHNASHIERVIAGQEAESLLLMLLDKVAAISFFVGTVFSTAIGICVAAKTLIG